MPVGDLCVVGGGCDRDPEEVADLSDVATGGDDFVDLCVPRMSSIACELDFDG